MSEWITPDWPAPSIVRAISTHKGMGNLATHVGDDPIQVTQNRKRLEELILKRGEPIHWLNQCHTAVVARHDSLEQVGARHDSSEKIADACYTTQSDTVCAVLTADCLPVLLCDTKGSWVAAVHGGWRGLLGGVLLNTLRTAPVGTPLMAWLGPAISVKHYEVGAEVREAFLAVDHAYDLAFHPKAEPQKFLLDLYEVARIQLKKNKVAVFGGEYCTYSDERFYSYRRENPTGRQATMIWTVTS